MTPTAMHGCRWYRGLLVVLISLAVIMTSFGVVRAAPVNCVADWYVSYGGASSFLLVHTDPDDLPLSDLRFSRSYNDPTDLSHGYLDFGRDHRSDVFSAVPIGGGNYRWRYVLPGPGVTSTTWSDWINLAFDSTPPDELRFGDFNRDGFTDVFSITPIGSNVYQWRYSPGGSAGYQNLATDTTPLADLRFGDFNGDGSTDVFALKGSGPIFSWDVSLSGTQNYVVTNTQTTALSEMQFGDINSDGHTDVFTTIPDAGSNDWLYSSGAHGPYQSMVPMRPESVHDVLLAGNFDTLADSNVTRFHSTDVFYTLSPQAGGYQWWYFYYQATPSTIGDSPLAFADTPPDQLRFADFNGDGVSDVFVLKQRCSLNLPFLAR